MSLTKKHRINPKRFRKVLNLLRSIHAVLGHELPEPDINTGNQSGVETRLENLKSAHASYHDPLLGEEVTYICPCVLYHLLTWSLKRLHKASGLDYQLMALRFAAIPEVLVEGVNIFDQGWHGVDIARPGGEGEVSFLRHVGVLLRKLQKIRCGNRGNVRNDMGR